MSNLFIETMRLIMAALPGYAERSYKMATSVVLSITQNVLGNQVKHITNQFRHMIDGWVSQISQVDCMNIIRRETSWQANRWAKHCGLMTDDNQWIVGHVFATLKDGKWTKLKEPKPIIHRNPFRPAFTLNVWRFWKEKARIAVCSNPQKAEALAVQLEEMGEFMKKQGNKFMCNVYYERAKTVRETAAEIYRMFKYMKGIGFVIKSCITETEIESRLHYRIWDLHESMTNDVVTEHLVKTRIPQRMAVEVDVPITWEDIAFKLRGFQIALAYLKIDHEEHTAHVALYDCTMDRVPVLTEEEMDMVTFDRNGKSTDERLSRCYAQDGHPFFRGRDEGVFDGLGEVPDRYIMQEWTPHDKSQQARDEFMLVNRTGSIGRVNKVSLCKVAGSWPMAIMGDFNRQALYEVPGIEGQLPIWAEKQLQFRRMMGEQLEWIDLRPRFNEEKRSTSYFQTLCHRMIVSDPSGLCLSAHRAIHDPEDQLPVRFRATDDGAFALNRCIFDIRLTNWFKARNKNVVAVSRPQSANHGDYVWMILHMISWNEMQVIKLFKLDEWRYLFNMNAVHEDFVHLAIQVEGDIKNQVIDLMGTQVIPLMRNGQQVFTEYGSPLFTTTQRRQNDVLHRTSVKPVVESPI